MWTNTQDYFLGVTGEHSERGYLVFVDQVSRSISHAQFLVLLELVLARLSTRTGFLAIHAMSSTDGDPELTRKVIQRLRQQLGGKACIQNNYQGAYRLACAAEEIEIEASLFKLPSTVVSQRLLEDLRIAYQNIRRPIRQLQQLVVE